MENRMKITRSVSPSGWLLAGLWSTALVLGVWIGWKHSAVFAPVLREAARCPARFSGCLTSASAGLLVTVIGELLVGKAIIWGAAPVHAFGLGTAIGAVGCWAGASVWMAALLLISPLLTAPVLLFIWNRMLCSSPQNLVGLFVGAAAAVIAAAGLNFRVVSPFLMEVIYF